MNLTHVGTREIQTERLLLRKFIIEDANDMFTWAQDEDVCRYIPWKPHPCINYTKNVISNWIEGYEKLNCYNWAIIHKQSNTLIGSIIIPSIWEDTCCAEVGYCIGKEFWNNGYATEALRAVVHYMFIEVSVNRLQAKHDIDNIASGYVLKKAGMRHEGVLRQNIIKDGELRDSCLYAVLKTDIFNNPLNYYYENMKVIKGQKIEIACKRILQAVPEKDYVTNYLYDIRILNGRDSIGKFNFKIGFNNRIYYSGHIGYQIYEQFRGNSYSAEACMLIKDIAKQLGFKYLLITNNPQNIASRKVCEKIGAKLIRIADLPEDHELYKIGERKTCIYQWSI